MITLLNAGSISSSFNWRQPFILDSHTILQHFYKKSSPWFRPKQATCQPTQYVPWVTHTVVASKNQSMGIFIGNSVQHLCDFWFITLIISQRGNIIINILVVSCYFITVINLGIPQVAVNYFELRMFPAISAKSAGALKWGLSSLCEQPRYIKGFAK